MLTYIADALLILGLLVMTISVIGVLLAPDIYTQIHAASKSVVLGVVSICVALMLVHDGAERTLALLIAIFLIMTTPVVGHVLTQSARRSGLPMQAPGALDESRPEFWDR